MRGLVHSAIIGEPSLTDDVPADRWYEVGALVDNPPTPFAILNYGPRAGVMKAVSARTLRISVYDQRGSYDLIDRVIKNIEELLPAWIDVTQGDSRLTEASWIGSSGDLDAPEYQANMRYVEFRIAGR